MDFVKDWPQYALEGEASHYLERHDVLPDISEQTRYLIFFTPCSVQENRFIFVKFKLDKASVYT